MTVTTKPGEAVIRGGKLAGQGHIADEENLVHSQLTRSSLIGSWLAVLPSLLPLVFLLLGTSTVVFLSICTPPFQTPDEDVHLMRAYQVSNGVLFHGDGGEVDEGIDEAFSHYSQLPHHPDAKATAADKDAAASVRWTGRRVYIYLDPCSVLVPSRQTPHVRDIDDADDHVTFRIVQSGRFNNLLSLSGFFHLFMAHRRRAPLLVADECRSCLDTFDHLAGSTAVRGVPVASSGSGAAASLGKVTCLDNRPLLGGSAYRFDLRVVDGFYLNDKDEIYVTRNLRNRGSLVAVSKHDPSSRSSPTRFGQHSAICNLYCGHHRDSRMGGYGTSVFLLSCYGAGFNDRYER